MQASTALNRFSIRQRLYACVLLVSIVILGLGAWSQFAQRQSLGALQAVLDQQQATTARIGELRAALARLKQREMGMMITSNTLEIERQRELWQAESKTLASGFAALGRAHERARSQAGVAAGALAEYTQRIAPLADQLVAAKIDGAAAGAYAEQAAPHLAQASTTLDALASQLEGTLAATRTQVEQRASLQTALSAGFGLLAIALVAVVMTITVRSICEPLEGATQVAQTIAEGDLSGAAGAAAGRDEAARMLRALHEMRSSLAQIVTQVMALADAVADTSSQIAQGNVDLSQRTEEQASTLEETASSMEELTSTVAHNADHARQASELALQASDIARKGGQVVGQVVATMSGISDASRRIGDITGVIDGIAFQTNILALNAAVEAARAGEQGRGFAVVAAEVRNLAQRSAAAAKEIKTLIEESRGKVEAGAKLVDTAGRTMEEVVTSVKSVSDLIAEIAAAGKEQSAGIQQVNTAVSHMEHVVQQNASLVEEAAAATESMKEQARALLAAVSRFRLADGARLAGPSLQAVAAAPAAPAPIRVRPTAALQPAYAAALPAGARRGPPQAGQWESF